MSAGTDSKSLYEQASLRISLLEQQLAQLQKMIFCSRHERFIPADHPVNKIQELLPHRYKK